MDKAEQHRVVERYVSAFNAHDLDEILSLYAEDATMEDPVGTPPAKGKEAISAFYREGFGMDVKLELDGAIRCARQTVAFPLRTSGSPELFIIDVFEFDAKGRIARMRAYWSPEEA